MMLQLFFIFLALLSILAVPIFLHFSIKLVDHIARRGGGSQVYALICLSLISMYIGFIIVCLGEGYNLLCLRIIH